MEDLGVRSVVNGEEVEWVVGGQFICSRTPLEEGAGRVNGNSAWNLAR